MTAPFSFQQRTVVRATIDEDGVIHHLLEPCCHGNPLSEQGVLAYCDFGIDLLAELNDAGFRDSQFVCYNSNDWGYPRPNIAFVSRKS